MTDITMCHGGLCPLKDTCHRHTTKASELQSYFVNPPFVFQTNSCDYYWEVENDRQDGVS